jgi:hypothetical protein
METEALPMDPLPSPQPTPAPAKPRRYVSTLGPTLRGFLFFIFGCCAFLGATGFYLLAIRGMEAVRQETLQTFFSIGMVLAHIVVGLALVVPLLIFGGVHLYTSYHRPNRVAVRLGIVVLILGLIVVATGIVLVQLEGFPQLPTDSITRQVVLWLHILVPVAATWAYVKHRKAGPRIQWKWGYAWGGAVVVFVAAMLGMHSQNPRQWFAKGSTEGEKYFEPSRARTADGKFIAAESLMMDTYCMKCHQDAYESHRKSVHHFSSFNNPAYLFSVQETRRTAGVRASRWCAGCHDPVPFFSGQFDDPNFDMKNNPTASAGVTCVVCHSVSHVNSRSGNADYTIGEVDHYPFAFSDNPALQWINNQLIKAKPELHKKTFLKPFHRSEEFCSTCHKVGLPQEVNHYKEFLRGQNTNDSFHLSGVSGHGARSFYYPATAKNQCADCHMALVESKDFGARDFDGTGKRKIHDHQFPGGNTGLHELMKAKHPQCVDAMENVKKFLVNGPDGKSPTLRIDLFGLKEINDQQRGIDGPLVDNQPLRPHLPKLHPGRVYFVETVLRTLNMGHHFTQGTADSNEIWVEFTAKSGGKIIGSSGLLTGDDEGALDPRAHTLNVLMLDRFGNRIDRRNPQDIFTPLYDHQIAPGAAQVVHYQLAVPKDVTGPIELKARVRYRKFDTPYLEHMYGKGKAPKLPIVDLCSDTVILPVAGVAESVPAQTSPIKLAWQRWNDYGIGNFLEGSNDGSGSKSTLVPAENAFLRLLGDDFKDAKAAHAHAYTNLARVYVAHGSPYLDKARDMLIKARDCEPKAPWQTVAWLNGRVNALNNNLEEAIKHFEQVVDPKNKDQSRKFDFTSDWVVLNDLGMTLFSYSNQFTRADDRAQREQILRRAVATFEKTLKLDAENAVAHSYLQKCHAALAGDLAPSTAKAVTSPLLDQLQALADTATPIAARMEQSRTLAAHLAKLQADKAIPAAPELIAAHAAALRAQRSAEQQNLRLAIAPLVVQLDAWLLSQVPPLSRTFTDAKKPKADRLEAGDQLAQVLARLQQRPSQEDAVTPLAAALSWPNPGLPASLALQGLASGGHLQGPLPAPRLLTLYAARPGVLALSMQDDRELAQSSARVLARMHDLMFAIFRPDDNAQDSAVRRHRERFPLTVPASQSVLVVELKAGN